MPDHIPGCPGNEPRTCQRCRDEARWDDHMQENLAAERAAHWSAMLAAPAAPANPPGEEP